MGEKIESWRKSSYSGNGGEQCVEVGTARDRVAVRDTTDRGGVTLSVNSATWTAFLGTLR